VSKLIKNYLLDKYIVKHGDILDIQVNSIMMRDHCDILFKSFKDLKRRLKTTFLESLDE